MKFIDDFLEKKTQDALRKENEQLERIARLSELESRSKQKRRMLLHPLKTANERKEINDLKKEISAYEENKKDRVALVILGGLIVGGMVLLCLSGLFQKTPNGNANANEATVAETSVESEPEIAVKNTTDAEAVAVNDEQSSSANSIETPVVADTNVSSVSNETVDQGKTELIEEKDKSTESEDEMYVLNTSDLKIDGMTDYGHYGDSLYLGNDEGLNLTITINKSDALSEDLFFYYDESLLNVDISEPTYMDNKTRIKAYVTAYEECEAELIIGTIYELSTLGDKANYFSFNIRKLDPEEGRVIYVTPSGSKYHLDPDCAGENAIATTYYDAEMMEIDPCGKCVN